MTMNGRNTKSISQHAIVHFVIYSKFEYIPSVQEGLHAAGPATIHSDINDITYYIGLESLDPNVIVT